jgi:hypothetical protein
MAFILGVAVRLGVNAFLFIGFGTAKQGGDKLK